MLAQKQLARLSVMILFATLDGFAAGGKARSAALGVVVSGGGPISIGHEVAPPSTVFFSGDVISTSATSKAVMSFRSGGSAILAEGSEVALAEDQDQTDIVLQHGTLIVHTRDVQPLRVGVLGSSVVVVGQTGFPALCRIASIGRTAAVFADRGRVEIHGAGAPVVLPAGKHLQLEAGQPIAAAGPPQAAGQKAGTVSNAIPNEVVQRQGQTAEIPLKLKDDVNWQDLVKTLKAGRVRMELLDGSVLNVGARSQMRIVKHDPQAQQTEAELTVGRLRAEVVKLTKSTGSFQVRTQTAVIGVVGTIFLIHATVKFTRVWSIDGPLRVSNAVSSVVGTATVNTGEFVTVPRGLPPGGVAKFSPANLHAEESHTALGPAPVQPGQVATVARVAANTGAKTAALGAQATGAVLAGAAVSKVGGAKDTLTATNTTLSSAVTQNNAAATAANNALNAATNLNVGTVNLTNSVSPSRPGCGCQ